MSAKIVVAGVTSLYMAVPVEEFPVPYESTRKAPWLRVEVAGTACHVADTLQGLGDQVNLCSVVGADLAGEVIRTELRTRGLLGPGVVNGPESSLGVVLVAPDGSRRGQPYLAAVDAVEYPVDVFRSQVEGADLAVLTSTRFVRPLLEHAGDLDVPVAVDMHVIADIDDEYSRRWLELADIVFCSHEKLPCPPEEWVAGVFDRYPGCAIAGVGEGERGCVLGLRDGRLIRAGAVAPRGVVSTAGSGDALFASFLHAWLATGNPVEALRSAVVHAGWKVGGTTPMAASLSEAELGALCREHPVTTHMSRWDDR